MRRASLIPLAALVAACGTEPRDPQEILQVDFVQVPYDTSLVYITDLVFLPDESGELLAIDLYGRFEHARLDPDGVVPLLSGRFDDVYTEFDAGQLGLALDPGFADNDLFYIAANLAKDHVQIRRYKLDRNSFGRTRESEAVIVDLRAPSSRRWHNISSMGFDEEGVMWALVGDKGLFDPAQDESNILGTLIRIVPSTLEGVGGYTTPEDGPTYSETSNRAVYTIGIRSPWKGRYYQGRWYFGDVGLDDFEEVNVISRPGQNLGWPVVEGLCEDDVRNTDPDCALYDDPAIAYGRSSSEQFVRDDLRAVPTNKRSVYVGWIYQPRENDPYDGLWDDVLVFGDAYVGFMRAASLEALDASWHLGHMGFPTAWGQAPDGFVYMSAYPGEPPKEPTADASSSPLYRLVAASPQ